MIGKNINQASYGRKGILLPHGSIDDETENVLDIAWILWYNECKHSL